MNSESFSESSQPAVSSVSSIGARLKRAREELRLTITDIARQLRLTEERIVALEGDNYENMPGLTFVKGYLRSYARLVNLPSDELILDFDRLNLMPETKTLLLSSHYQPVLLSNKSLRWLVYLISAGLLILAITWWSSSANNDATNLNSTELKRQPVKNMPATTDAISSVNNSANAANTAVNAQSAQSGAETIAANSAPVSTVTDPKTHSSAGQAATSAASQQLPTTSAAASSADSKQTSDKQIKTQSSTAGSADEDNEEVKPHKKPATRSHSRAQFDEPFDDE